MPQKMPYALVINATITPSGNIGKNDSNIIKIMPITNPPFNIKFVL